MQIFTVTTPPEGAGAPCVVDPPAAARTYPSFTTHPAVYSYEDGAWCLDGGDCTALPPFYIDPTDTPSTTSASFGAGLGATAAKPAPRKLFEAQVAATNTLE